MTTTQTQPKPSLGKPTAVMLGAPVLGVVLFLVLGWAAQAMLVTELVWLAIAALTFGLVAGGVGFAWLIVNLWRR